MNYTFNRFLSHLQITAIAMGWDPSCIKYAPELNKTPIDLAYFTITILDLRVALAVIASTTQDADYEACRMDAFKDIAIAECNSEDFAQKIDLFFQKFNLIGQCL